MRKTVFIFIMGVLLSLSANSQEVSCKKLMNYVVKNANSSNYVNCFNSSMLIKVKWYSIEQSGVIIAYIKQNDYDIYGKPYIFCGISKKRWEAFKSGGMFGSWGKSFHKYIIDYKCDCY